MIRAAAIRFERPVLNDLPVGPYMHQANLYHGAFLTLLVGGTVVTARKLRPESHLVWGLVEQYRVTELQIEGDGIAGPLLDALVVADQQGNGYKTDSLSRITSSHAIWSKEMKAAFLHYEALRTVVQQDKLDQSISGPEEIAQTATFLPFTGVRLFDESDKLLTLGAAASGKLALANPVALGYLGDSAPTTDSFQTNQGQRWAFSGDHARLSADGEIVLTKAEDEEL